MKKGNPDTLKRILEKHFKDSKFDGVDLTSFANEVSDLMNGYEPDNFFNKSLVSGFFEEQKLKLADSLCIDYDSRFYIRIMKLFDHSAEAGLTYHYKEDSEILNREMNKPFHLRYYLPKEPIRTIGAKNRKLVIMINGMNELTKYDMFDNLGEFFASNNIAAVLLPTPFHLNRRIESDYELKRTAGKVCQPTDRAKQNPQLFYLSYLKTYKELTYLIDRIKGKKSGDATDDAFYEHYFDHDKTEITLLGYSLGGIKSLAYFMHDFTPMSPEKMKDKSAADYNYDYVENDYLKKVMPKQKINCCITLNSSPNLSEAQVAEMVGMEQSEWRSLIHKSATILDEDEAMLIKEHNAENIIKLFRFLYTNPMFHKSGVTELGETRSAGIVENYLAINGGDDTIINSIRDEKNTEHKTSSRDGIERNQKPVYNRFIVAKADHFPAQENDKWHEQFPVVERSVLDFINSCGIKLYKREILLAKIKKILQSSNISSAEGTESLFDYAVKHGKDVFNRDIFETILNNIEKNDRADFLKYYFRSKAFYATFQEVLRIIAADRIRP